MKISIIIKLSSILCFILFMTACNSSRDSAVTVDTTNNGVIEFNFSEEYTMGQFANGDYWPPLFDYIDRYYATEQPDAFPDYVVDLWDAYR